MMKTAFYLFVIKDKRKRKTVLSFFLVFFMETKKFGGGLSHQKYKYLDSDEYFTPIKTVENIFSKLPTHVKEKKIWFPCDGQESTFVKYAQKERLIYKNSSDDFRKRQDLLAWCDIVITNPPFTLMHAFCKFIKNKQFAFIAPHIRMHTVFNNLPNVRFFSISRVFTRPDETQERVGVVCANSFEITDNRTYSNNETSFEYEDKTGLPILNSIKLFPTYEKAPNEMLVPFSFLQLNFEGWQPVRIFDHPLVNNKAKFRRLLIRKKI